MSAAAASRAGRPVPLADETRALLMEIGTATLASTLFKLGLRNTCLLGLEPIALGQPRMVGPAFTLRFIPAREDLDSMATYASEANLHRRAIEECPEGAVLVIDAHGDTTAASAGDIMAARLKARGAKGMVTDGGFRDTPSMRKLGLPAFQRQAAPPATPLALHPVELNAPIGCAGVAVYPGDIMLGDDEGVVAIPSHLAAQVAREACEALQYEEFVTLQIARGRSLLGLFPATEDSRREYRKWIAEGRPQGLNGDRR